MLVPLPGGRATSPIDSHGLMLLSGNYKNELLAHDAHPPEHLGKISDNFVTSQHDGV